MKVLQQPSPDGEWQRHFDESVVLVGTGPCFVLVGDRMPRARVWKCARSERSGSR